jgi:CDP-diacylglycerol--serine O-phosphatidyltransferase
MIHESRHKSIYILPNLFTTASLFTGFLALLWAIEGKFQWAATGIVVSCILDGLDGKVARLTGSSSKFGVQLDSLADLVSFGVLPSLLIYLWQTSVFGRLGMACSFLFLACGALRLARFNIQTDSPIQKSNKFFVGLPIPAAASFLAMLVLFSSYLPKGGDTAALPFIALCLLIVLALLMVSQVAYASFKEVEVIRAHPFTATLSIVLLFVLVASEPRLLGFLFASAYLASGLIYTYLVRPLRRGTFLGGLIRHKP